MDTETILKRMGSVATVGVVLCLAATASAATRTYWIAAEEVVWDYAPSYPTNPMTGAEFTDEEKVFVGPGDGLIGRKYRKSVYVQKTANWAASLPRQDKDQHLGMLGPIIRAEVGDRIVVHFKNNTRYPASVHPHGVFYDKNSEGAPYEDGTSLKADDSVAPGSSHTYEWGVPRRAGPGPRDPDSIAWLYHSHSNEVADTNAGLVGPIVITRKGKAYPDGSPRGIDREFVSFFSVMNENASNYIGDNILEFAGGSPNPDAGLFEESNLMHSVNGMVYGNNDKYHMHVGEKVRWYVLSLGTEVDIHTPHWHGVTLLHAGQRIDVTEVFPGSSKTFDLRPDNPGMWMFHCHVNDHILAGMHAMFHIGMPHGGAPPANDSDDE